MGTRGLSTACPELVVSAKRRLRQRVASRSRSVSKRREEKGQLFPLPSTLYLQIQNRKMRLSFISGHIAKLPQLPLS